MRLRRPKRSGSRPSSWSCIGSTGPNSRANRKCGRCSIRAWARSAPANPTRSHVGGTLDGEGTNENLPSPLVREGSGGGGEVLRVDLPGFAGGPRRVTPERVAQRSAGFGEGGELHVVRPALPGDERRATPRVQRRRLLRRHVRRPGGARSLLERVARGRRQAAGVRMAHRSIRGAVADRSHDPGGG